MCRRRSHCDYGFTLVELMLAALLGCLICGVALQLLYSESLYGATLAQRTTLKQWQRRSLDLVKGDLEHASSWQIDPDPSAQWPCALAGRQPKLLIQPKDGSAPLLYSLGPAPSTIWRGTVLMRCGPAFDLNGRIRVGSQYQNRVVLDDVDHFQLTQPSGLPLLQLTLVQSTRPDGPSVSTTAVS